MKELDLRTSRLSLGDGSWLHVVETGPVDGPPILLVHGAAGSWHNWYLQMRSLSKRYRVIAPDLRGHGASPWPGPGHVDDFYGDLKKLALQHIEGPFVAMGHSFGGLLSTRLAVEMPDRVGRLILLNSGGHLPRGLVFRFLQLFCGHTDKWTRVHPYSVSCDSRVAQYVLFHTLKEWYAWSLYPQVQCPTLVVLGKYDALVPVSFGERMVKALPQATLKIIQGGGHVCMWESPKLLLSWLKDFLDAPVTV